MKKDYQVLPPLTDEEYAELKADIAERGVMVPIELDEDGNCLDGHHRLRACRELGITKYPSVVRAGLSEEAKIEHALIVNAARRSLTEDQKIEVAMKVINEHPEFSFRRLAKILNISPPTVAKLAGENDFTPARHEGEDGKQYPASAGEAQSKREAVRDMISNNPEMSNKKIAEALGVSDHTVAKQREVVDNIVSVFNPSKRDREALKDPDIQRRLAENEDMNVAGAIREQTRDQLIESLDSIEAREAKAVEGVYDVIVIDPPWDMRKIETDSDPHAVELDYPTMTIEEIKQLEIPAADTCHVFLWTTQKYLPAALDILKAWGVKYVCEFVWHKNGGYKPFGLPIYNCEFCLYGHIGSPKFIDEKRFRACFNADITGHSEKPEAFYATIRRVTAGRRLDMFNRRHIDGFDSWGKEAVE